MGEPRFAIIGACVGERALEPHVALDVELALEGAVASGTLAVTVRVEPQLRRFEAHERALLTPLFGPPELWTRSLASLLWTRVTVLVPAFEERAVLTVPLPCSHALEHAVGKLLAALEGGALPIALDVRGTLLLQSEVGGAPPRLEARPVGWRHALAERVPVALVREALDASLGDRRVVALPAELHARLRRYAMRCGAPSDDEALTRLLEEAGG